MPYQASWTFRPPPHRIRAQQWFPGAAPVTARDFDGASTIALSPGVVTPNGAYTVVGLFRISSLTGGSAVVGTVSAAGNFNAGLQVVNATGKLRAIGGTGSPQDSPTLALSTGKWVIGGYTHGTGTVAPRFHLYQDGAWSHEDAAGTLAHVSAPDHLRIGSGESTGTPNVFCKGTIAALAWWNSAVSDGNIETLDDGWKVQDWWDVTPPAGLWRLNQPDTSTAVLDQSGSGANQTAITGTTVVQTGPQNWNYRLVTGTLGATATTNSAKYAGGLGAEPTTSDFNGVALGAAPTTANYPDA